MNTQFTQPIPKVQGRVGTPQAHIQSAIHVAQQVKNIRQNQGQNTQNLALPRSKATPSQKVGKTVGILGQKGNVTQQFGQRSQYDVFSNQISPAFEVGVPSGTQLTAPPGNWKVVKAYNGASQKGYVGNSEGDGWGNHVRLQNTQTGETVGLNHMSDVAVKEGDTIQGGTDLGASGMSGNATGPHVAFTYQNAQGQSGDFAQSPYMQYLYQGIQNIGQAVGGAAQAIGGVVGNIGQAIGNFIQRPQAMPQTQFPSLPQVTPIQYNLPIPQSQQQQQPFQIYGSNQS